MSDRAAEGRALLEEWKAQHSKRRRAKVDRYPTCLCGFLAPCPTARLVAAVEEALSNVPWSRPQIELAILAKIAEGPK